MKLPNAKILVLAIVKAAVNDYNRALKQLETNPKYSLAISTKAEIEGFLKVIGFQYCAN